MKIHVAHNIKQLRLQRNLTQPELAQMLSSARRQLIMDWEKGTHHPHLFHLIALAKIFKVDLDTFVFIKLPKSKNIIKNGRKKGFKK